MKSTKCVECGFVGWSDIETEYPIEACELLFRAQGRSLAQTDCLDRVVLAELSGALGDPVDACRKTERRPGRMRGDGRNRVARRCEIDPRAPCGTRGGRR